MLPDRDYREKPSPELLRTWWISAVVLWVISAPVYIWWIVPRIDFSKALVPLSGIWPVVWLLIPSLALGLLYAIVRHRTATLPRVFAPTRARITGALAFWVTLPIAILVIFPVSAGFVFVEAMRHLNLGVVDDIVTIAGTLLLLGVSYGAACLLSHGLPQKAKRMAGYLLMWLGCASMAAALGMMQRYMM
ncbi:MAG: hypothetical protein AB8B82_08365 [Roseovarius sp.]